MKPLSILFLSLLFLSLLASCNVMIPAHEKSRAIANEDVSIVARDFSDKEKSAYHKVFPEEGQPLMMAKGEGTRDFAAIGAAVGAEALGLVIDLVQKAIDKEKVSYEAEWKGQAVLSNCWTASSDGATRTWKYPIVEVTRKTSSGDASRTVLGLGLSFDKKSLLVVPLSHDLSFAKPKVVAVRWWSYLPVFWWHAALEAEQAVATTMTIEANVRVKGDQFSTGSVVLDMGAIVIGTTKAWSGSGAAGVLPVPDEKGLMQLSISVKEKDASNAATFVGKASEQLEKNKENIIKVVFPLGGQANPPDSPKSPSLSNGGASGSRVGS